VKLKLFLILLLISAAPALAQTNGADQGRIINIQNGVTVKTAAPEKPASAKKEDSSASVKASEAEDEEYDDEEAPAEPAVEPKPKTLKMKPILGTSVPIPAKPSPFKKSPDANTGETVKKPTPKPEVTAKPLTGTEESISDESGLGASGLPIPRFVSLKSGEVNARTGPGDSYPIRWVYQRKNLPVEVTAEFKLWRRIKDFDGEQSWVHQALTSNRRYAILRSDTDVYSEYNEEGALAARMKRGVQVQLLECDANFCRVEYGHIGRLRRRSLQLAGW